MEEQFDCIIVGGGIAGLSAAMTLARAQKRFLLVERGEFCGAKNVSGGVLWGQDLAELVPNYWEHENAGFERFVNHRRLSFLDKGSAFSVDFKSDHFEDTPYIGLSVLRARFDAWLADEVQKVLDETGMGTESFLATNVRVDDLVTNEAGKVTGIQAGEEVFEAGCVILAEGVNNLLTRKAGIEPAYVSSDYVAVGVKEVIQFPEQTLVDRFQLRGRSGLTNEFIGSATDGVEGGGFLYTNRDSLSVGLVLGMNALKASGKTPYDILNTFKAHPAVRDMIAGGEAVEYSAHVVSTGDARAIPSRLHGDGLLVVGEAAHLLLNAGKAIQGMDFAMRSGILAARTVIDAADKADFSQAQLQSYRKALDASYVMKDIKQFQGAVHLLHSEAMFSEIPNLICDIGRQFFTISNEPTPKTWKMIQNSIRAHSSYSRVLSLGLRGALSL